MSAAKWENRFHKQVEANNLLSDKLRNTREVGQRMIDALREAFAKALEEIKDLKFTIQIMEEAILKESKKREDA